MEHSIFFKAAESLPVQRYAADVTDRVYETHQMEHWPVIFHRDEVRAGCFCPTNWHENLEILLFTEGEGQLVCENECVAVEGGDICIIDSDLLHRVESHACIHYFCLIVDSGFCRDNGLDPSGVRFVRRLKSNDIAEQYHNVAEAFVSSDPYRSAAVRAEVLRLMVMLFRTCRISGIGTPLHKTPSGIRLAISYVRAHYAEELPVDILAREAGLSKFHFVREFKRITGQTPVTHINMVRIEQAARMLENGNGSVAEVAAACGFSSPSYFSKIFLRLRGILPSAWAEHCAAQK